jgi:hypothetical protein
MIKFITVLSKNNPNKQYAYYQTLKKNTTVIILRNIVIL